MHLDYKNSPFILHLMHSSFCLLCLIYPKVKCNANVQLSYSAHTFDGNHNLVGVQVIQLAISLQVAQFNMALKGNSG